MIDANDLQLTLTRLKNVLDDLPVKYHLTGGLASSYYGEPRFTQDIDVVLIISEGILFNSLIEKLSDKFIIDSHVALDSVARKTIFQALDEESMIKVDFHVGEAIEGELGRSLLIELFPGISIPLVSKEDAVLSKLLWIKKGSHKSRQDVAMMLKNPDKIDRKYLNIQALKLGVQEILKEFES